MDEQMDRFQEPRLKDRLVANLVVGVSSFTPNHSRKQEADLKSIQI